MPQRELRKPPAKKKKTERKAQAYIATYNKNNPELFKEIMKSLEETETKSKKY